MLFSAAQYGMETPFNRNRRNVILHWTEQQYRAAQLLTLALALTTTTDGVVPGSVGSVQYAAVLFGESTGPANPSVSIVHYNGWRRLLMHGHRTTCRRRAPATAARPSSGSAQ